MYLCSVSLRERVKKESLIVKPYGSTVKPEKMKSYNNLTIEKTKKFNYLVDFNGEDWVFTTNNLKKAVQVAEESAKCADMPCYYAVYVQNTITYELTEVVKYEVK